MILCRCHLSQSTSLYRFHKHFLFLDSQFSTAIDSFYREDVIIQLSSAVFIKATVPPAPKWERVQQKTVLFNSSCSSLLHSCTFSLRIRWGLSPHGLLVSVICISLIHHDCLRWMEIHQELIFISVSVVVSNRHSSLLKQLDVIWFPQVCTAESVSCRKWQSGFISFYLTEADLWLNVNMDAVLCIYVEVWCSVNS